MRSLFLAVTLSLALAAGASAGEKTSFTKERFESLQSKGELVLIDVHASWCPTCAKQQEILSSFKAKHPDVPLHVLTVDFDDQKEWVKHFRAPRQSTLLLYRGEEQVWFSVAETRSDVIFEKLLKAAEAE
ncbi:MAG: thioredoxin family protein [Acidobacteria bacterium]|nr:thioredoxin family protein [Acidobacteriota bacterium]